MLNIGDPTDMSPDHKASRRKEIEKQHYSQV